MPSSDISRIKFALTEYRSIKVEDLSVQTRHPLAVDLTYNTLINSSSDATDFGTYVMGLRSTERYSWQAFINKVNYPNLEIGDTITITYPRFGFSGGKNFIVKRLKRDSESLYHEVTLFGPQ